MGGERANLVLTDPPYGLDEKKLRVVNILSKKYNRFIVVMGDDSIFEYDLNEYKVFRGEEWVEVEKNDKTEMDCFSIGNIMRVRFTKINNKVKEVTVLKPIPPTAA